MADERTTSLGPTGEQVRANVQRLRESAGLTKKQLSDRVGELGRAIPPLGISRIEMGTRRVDADDLMALTVALGVHPAALLLPPTARTHDFTASGEAVPTTVEITGAGEVAARAAWEWAHGMRPLPSDTDDPDKAWRYFSADALPDGWRGMPASTYAQWDAEQARKDYERLLDLTGDNADGSWKDRGDDG
ncbi:helix-turn-helix domain-containing protein [Streptomyces sp. NPDC005774]|uniref:helix-turn-helix domain-containing protein n=1 Tax=Streptomyces sp. NPDC005774 TaxID=3364728 RepID=UPI003689D1B9